MSNMIDKTIIGKSGIPLLEKMMDLTTVRHKLIAGNIANVSTPGFKSKDIDFHGELNKALDQMQGGIESSRSNIEVVEDENSESNGINFVDIDSEMAKLAENQIFYNAAARLIKGKFEGLRKAITSK